jgi:hypothetical protein
VRLARQTAIARWVILRHVALKDLTGRGDEVMPASDYALRYLWRK